MKYRVYDEEDRKERTLCNCITDLGGVGNTKRVSIKKGDKTEVHHFRVLEVLPDVKLS